MPTTARRHPCALVLALLLQAATLAAPAIAATTPAASSAAVHAHHQLTPQFAVENSWPPYSHRDGSGISRTLVTRALQLEGIAPQFLVQPYARVLFSIQKGDVVGGFNITRQQSTESLFIFGEEPLLLARASFYFRPGDEARYQTLRDLPDGTRIGLIIDYEYGDEYERQRGRFAEIRVSHHEQLIKMLLKNRVDTILMFDAVGDYSLQQLRAEAGDVRWDVRRGMANHESRIFVGFSRQHPEAASLAAALDRGLRRLRQSGAYQRIINGDAAALAGTRQNPVSDSATGVDVLHREDVTGL